MNHTPEDDKLDDLLNDWALDATSEVQFNSLHKRIVDTLTAPIDLTSDERRTESHDDKNQIRLPPQHDVAESRRSGSGFAITAALTMVLLLVVALSRSDVDSSSPNTECAPAVAWFQKQQLHDKNILLTEMRSVFGEHLTWLAETNKHVEFGLREPADRSNAAAANGHNLAVRLIVQRRQPSSSDWQIAWAMDVVSRSEDVVHIAPHQANGNELRMWVYELPDGAIAVDSEVQLAGKNSFRAQMSKLHQNRTPVEVAAMNDNGMEYRVFQTVTVLNQKVI